MEIKDSIKIIKTSIKEFQDSCDHINDDGTDSFIRMNLNYNYFSVYECKICGLIITKEN